MKLALSARPIRGAWLEQQNRRSIPLRDYEEGGPTINADTEDLRGYLWEALSDGTNITVGREGVAPVVYLTGTGITQIALAFDQAMRPHFAWVANGVAKFRYWDSLAQEWATMELPGAVTPRLCTDEKRPFFTNDTDVILCYMRSGALYARYQRDRYTIETLLDSIPDAVGLTTIGMNNVGRLQWQLQPKRT